MAELAVGGGGMAGLTGGGGGMAGFSAVLGFVA